MSKNNTRPRLGQLGLAFTFTLALQACGGGSSGTSPDAQSAQAQPYSTVSAYGQARAAESGLPGNDAKPPSDSTESNATDAALQLAMDGLYAGLAYENDHTNVLVVPALTAAHLNGLASASDGGTLSQLQSAFPELDQWTAELKRSQSVQRQVWSQQGRGFLRSFLKATDLSLKWQGGELDLAHAQADTGLDQTLKALHPYLGASSWDKTGDNRLVIVDAWQSKTSWSGATAFEGVFETESGSRKIIPMLRISEGVTRYSEAGFTANVHQGHEQTIMTIVPTSDSLATFVGDSKLRGAIAHTVAALLSGSSGVPPAAGELILPSGQQDLAYQLARTLYAKSAGQAYNEFDANLKRLDGTGGIYAKLEPTGPILEITASSLSLQVATTTQFIFSPRNRFNQPGPGGAYGVIISTTIVLPPCPHEPDLSSFFLITLDARHRVTSLAAIGYAGPGNAAYCSKDSSWFFEPVSG